MLPLGFFGLLLSVVPQFASYVQLVDWLDGNTTVTAAHVLLPNILSWLLMWMNAMVLCYGLRQKERLRSQLQRAGAVWTHNEAVARQLHETIEAAQRRVDELTGAWATST